MASIKRNFVYNLLLNVSSVIFPLITAPYVARVLDPDGLGLANFATTYANYFAMFAILGGIQYSIREISKRRDSSRDIQIFISEIFTLNFINSLIVSIVFIATIFCIPKLSSNKLLFLIAGFSIYLLPLKTDWYFIGLEKFGVITFRNLSIRVLSIICLFVFVKSKSDLWIYILLSILSSFGGIIWNIRMLYKDGYRLAFTKSGIQKHYKPMLVLFSSSVAISVYTMIDTLMLGFMADYTQTGYYNSATHLAKTLLAVVTSLSAVAVPRISYYFKNGNYQEINSLVTKSLSIVAFLAIPMTIGLACIAPVFIPLFLGKQFEGAVMPLIIMSFVITAIGFNNLTGIQILIGIGKDKRFLQCVLVGTISNFLLNLALIPIFGANGAAFASVVAETLILIATIYYVKKDTHVEFGEGTKDIWKSLLASLSFIPIAICLNYVLHGWWFVFSTILSCILTYFALHYFMHSVGFHLIYKVAKSRIKFLP